MTIELLFYALSVGTIAAAFLFGLMVGHHRGRQEGLEMASKSAIVRNRVLGKGGPLGLD